MGARHRLAVVGQRVQLQWWGDSGREYRLRHRCDPSNLEGARSNNARQKDAAVAALDAAGDLLLVDVRQLAARRLDTGEGGRREKKS
jgi:hypothetical protein